MGVKGLKTYITQTHKELSEKINIIEEVQKWSIDHGGKQPTIIIDLKELSHTLGGHDEIGIILGGRYRKYNAMTKRFLDQLKAVNAKLVFFAAGNKLNDTTEIFILHNEKKYIKYLTLLDTIENGNDLTQFLRNKNKFAPDIRMTLPIDFNLNKMCRQYGELNVTYVCHNKEMVEFISKNSDKILAILTNDTDFMAYEGDFQYWSARDLHLTKLDCVRYCKDKLKSKLDLSPEQLQLVSALSGHDFLPREYVEPFWSKLANEYGKKGPRIENLARFAKSQPMIPKKDRSDDVVFDVERISREVFGDDFSEEQMNGILNVLKYYGSSVNKNSTGQNAFLKFCKQNRSFMYKLATDAVYNIKDIEYIDYRNYKSKNFAELVEPILMKMCGILYKDDRSKPRTRIICMKFAHDEPSKLVHANVIYPPMELPPLFDLIFKYKESRFEKDRWILLSWLLDLDASFIIKLRSSKISKNFKVVVTTLEYLLQQEEISAEVANAIVLAEYRVMTERDTKYPKVPNAQYIRIAHLYTKLYVLINHCFDICGEQALTDVLQFDGAIFHNIMDDLQNNSNGNSDTEFFSQIKNIWIFE